MVILLAILAGVLFAGAPFTARASGLTPHLMALAVIIGGIIPFIPTLISQNVVKGLPLWVIGLGLLAGIFQGYGIKIVYMLVGGSMEGKWELGSALPMSIICTAIFIVLGGAIFFKEPVTTQRLSGLLLACIAIYLMR